MRVLHILNIECTINKWLYIWPSSTKPSIYIVSDLIFTAVSGDLMYCYTSDICEGGHPDGLPLLTGFGDCCQNGGSSWGLAGGHESSRCQACPNSWGAGDPIEMLKPGGMYSNAFRCCFSFCCNAKLDIIPLHGVFLVYSISCTMYTYVITVNYYHEIIWISVVENPGNLNYFTCMSYGPYYYRTFDGLEYLFGGRCKYTAFTDGSRSVEIGLNNCMNYGTCTKVKLLNL